MTVARREHGNRVLDKLGHSGARMLRTNRRRDHQTVQNLSFSGAPLLYVSAGGGRGNAAVAHRRTVLIISAREAKFNNTGEGRFSAAPKQAPLSKHPSAHQTDTIEIK
jgi:hypothetical protein